MCGIVGGFSPNLVDMLCQIQHRGFTSCGFVTRHSKQYAKRAKHLVKVREPGIGHVRYATQDSPPQPFKYRDSYLAFNGEVAEGDTEKIAHALYHGGKVDGAYSFVWMRGNTIIAGRDRNGFHPMFHACGEEGYVVASETVADPSLYWVEMPPGVILRLNDGMVEPKVQIFPPKKTPCSLEDVYFSHVANRGTWQRRKELGRLIKIPKSIDVIVPVPESAIAAAEALSEKTGVPMVSAIVKNRYSERTFIAECGFGRKYTLIPDAIRGKRIALIDDSIIRGNTMRAIVPKMSRYAAEVHVRVTFPQVRHPCRYGVRIDGPGCGEISEADSLEFLCASHFDGCLACVNGVYSSVETEVGPLTKFAV